MAFAFDGYPVKPAGREIRLVRAQRPPKDLGDNAQIQLEMETICLDNPPNFYCTLLRLRVSTKALLRFPEWKKHDGYGQFASSFALFLEVQRKHPRFLFPEQSVLSLWIDAICINQEDDREKAEQIRLMCDIFRVAWLTVAYIGRPPTTDPGEAFPTLCAISGYPVFLETGKLCSVKSDVWEELWSQQWMNRSWIFQEVVLATRLLCIYGDGQNSTSWDFESWMAMLRANIESSNNPSGPHVSGTRKYGLEEGTRGPWNLCAFTDLRLEFESKRKGLNPLRVLDKTRRFESFDIRDKVYAFLGLFNRADFKGFPIDYSPRQTPSKTFIDFAIHCIRLGHGMQVLECAGTPQTLPDLPSWVPDWTQEARQSIPAHLYRCAGSTISQISLKSNEKVKVQGVAFDRVNTIGFRCAYLKTEAFMRLPAFVPNVDNLWDFAMIVLIMAQELAKRIQSSDGLIFGEQLESVILRTLFIDQDFAHGRGTTSVLPFYEAFRYSRDDTYAPDKGKATQKLVEAGIDVTKVNELAKNFVSRLIYVQGRVLCATSAGRLGLLPNTAEVGDIIVFFFGGRVPFVLRPLGEGNLREWKIIGPCYIHGIMDGELVDKGGKGQNTAPAHGHQDFILA